jgi:hypothetical protein
MRGLGVVETLLMRVMMENPMPRLSEGRESAMMAWRAGL